MNHFLKNKLVVLIVQKPQSLCILSKFENVDCLLKLNKFQL
jgi:hypothetical protein